MIRVIGGMDPQGIQKAAEFYPKTVNAPIRTTDAKHIATIVGADSKDVTLAAWLHDVAKPKITRRLQKLGILNWIVVSLPIISD